MKDCSIAQPDHGNCLAIQELRTNGNGDVVHVCYAALNRHDRLRPARGSSLVSLIGPTLYIQLRRYARSYSPNKAVNDAQTETPPPVSSCKRVTRPDPALKNTSV